MEKVRTLARKGETKVHAEFWSVNVKDLLRDLGVDG
jgi:hypothetical protein